MSIDIDIDIDIQNFRTTIDDNITKFNSIVEVNNKCFQKLKKINFLKEIMENSDINPNLKKKLDEKEREILNNSLKITEIQTTEKLTIKEIMSEIITINNILNNNIITNFLIEIKKLKPPDYNLIIKITIKLIKNLKDLDKIDNYLLNTTQYNYINKLINNYLYNCIKIQNKTFEDIIVKINNIDKILEDKHNNNIINEFEDVNKKIDNTIVKKYIDYNEEYKQFIEFLKKLFKIQKNDYNQLINSLINQYNEYNDLRYSIINFKDTNYINNNFTIMKTYKKNISFNLNKSDNEYFKLIDEYNMILYYFDYIENFIIIKINYKENINIEEQNITKEDKEYQKIIFEDIILQNKNEIIKELIGAITISNLKEEIKQELLKNIKLDKLDDYIIFKCINYFNIKYKEQNQEQNQESLNKKNILQLLDKLLNIFILEQKIKLKDILNKISKKNQELNEYISIFEHKEKNLISIFNLKLNNDVRNNIYILKKYLFQEFKYDYKNNFKQILIDYDLEKLQNNIDKISVLHNNIQYFIDKLNYHIDLLKEKEKDSDLKYFIQIKDTQKEILNDIFNIKLIIQNIKEKSLNKILKNYFDNIQILLNKQQNSQEKGYIINIFKEIENYFIFKPEINITIISGLKEIFIFLNPYISFKYINDINDIVKQMIILEEKHNKDNIEKLEKYKEVKLYKSTIRNLLILIEDFNKDEVLKTVYDNLVKIYNHLNDNDNENDKNFSIIIKQIDDLMNINFDFNFNNLFKLDPNFDLIYEYLKFFIKEKKLFDNIKKEINVLNKELDEFYNKNDEYFNNSSNSSILGLFSNQNDPRIEVNKNVKENIRINIEHINNILLKNENPVNINILINLIENISGIIINENFWIGDSKQNQIKVNIGNKFLKLLPDINKKLSELLSNIEKIENIENIEPIFKYKNNDNFKKIIEDIEILIQDKKNNIIMSNIYKIKETLNKSELIEDDYISIKNQINIILNEVGCDTLINRYSKKNKKLCEIKEKFDNFKGLLITSNPSVISIITEISNTILEYSGGYIGTIIQEHNIKKIVELLINNKYKKIIYNNLITKYDDIIKTIDDIKHMLNLFCTIDTILSMTTIECQLLTKFKELQKFIS